MSEMIFENAAFLLVDKSAGSLSVPSRIGSEDARVCELGVWRERTGVRLLPVHRLDCEVSGLLLFAKTAEAHRTANLWFEGRLVGKTYECLAEMKAYPNEGRTERWQSLLLRGKKRAYEKPFGKKAITHATFLRRVDPAEKNLGLWSLKPETGRPHQLRYEMAKHGSPVWGDRLYGAAQEFLIPQAIGLRAVALDLTRCTGRENYQLPETFSAPGIEAWLKNQSSKSFSSK